MAGAPAPMLVQTSARQGTMSSLAQLHRVVYRRPSRACWRRWQRHSRYGSCNCFLVPATAPPAESCQMNPCCASRPQFGTLCAQVVPAGLACVACSLQSAMTRRPRTRKVSMIGCFSMPSISPAALPRSLEFRPTGRKSNSPYPHAATPLRRGHR